ncbi:MAG: NADH-quinone oxidoreductase subunit NuoK [Candidatus Eiseniibacteriota bacterium]|jgi:NADH-quinone oxidoreductase subunit K
MSILDPNSLLSYLFVSAVLFSLGTYGILSRRNAVSVLMAIELVLNSANVNFVAFSRFTAPGIDGQLFAIFVIILAAAEAAVALAIVLAIYHNFGTIDVNDIDSLRE